MNEHSTVAWLLSEIIRMQIETHGESRFYQDMKPLTGILIYRTYCSSCIINIISKHLLKYAGTKRSLDLSEDLISCLGHYNELECV